MLKDMRLALHRQTHNTRDKSENSSEVHFKRNTNIKWKGPGKVVGQNGAIIFIKCGGFFIKIHCW